MKTNLKKRNCSVCGNPFQPIRINNDKCSELCRTQWYRTASEKRYKDQRERNKKTHTLKNCRVCGIKFKAAPHRQNCSSECSERYIKEGLGFRHYYLKNKKIKRETPTPALTERDVGFDLKILKNDERYNERLTIQMAMEEYRDKGGKITVLADEPNQPLPSVNYEGGWDWYATTGVGTYSGAGDYIDIPELTKTNY